MEILPFEWWVVLLVVLAGTAAWLATIYYYAQKVEKKS